MRKAYHFHFELDYLIKRSDSELESMIRGGEAYEIRAELVILRAKGRKVMVIGPCSHKLPDGSCAGHPVE